MTVERDVEMTLRSPKSRRMALTWQKRKWGGAYDPPVRVTQGRTRHERAASAGRPTMPVLSHRVKVVWVGWHDELPHPLYLTKYWCGGESMHAVPVLGEAAMIGDLPVQTTVCRRCECMYATRKRI